MAMRRTTSMENAIPFHSALGPPEDVYPRYPIDRMSTGVGAEPGRLDNRYSTCLDVGNSSFGSSNSEFSPLPSFYSDPSRFRFPEYRVSGWYEYRSPLMVESLAPPSAPSAPNPITNLTRTLSHSLDSLNSEHAVEHNQFAHSDGTMVTEPSMSVSSIHPVLMNDMENHLNVSYDDDNVKDNLSLSPNTMHKILSNRTNSSDFDSRTIYSNIDPGDNNNPQTNSHSPSLFRVNFSDEVTSYESSKSPLVQIIEEDVESRGRESRSGTQTSEESTSAIHRRAVSDQSGFSDLNSQRVPFRDSRPASIRSAEGRCQSQVVLPETTNDLLNQQSSGNGIPQLDRKQSNSTPSLAEEDLNGEDATDPVPSEPPPVVLQRKVSSTNKNSWKNHFPTVGMSSHSIYSPQSIPSRGIAARNTLTESSKPSSRRNEKKEKTGSDTFSFSGLFKGRSKSRPALDLPNVITNLESRALGNGPGQLRRSTASSDSMASMSKRSFDGLPDHIRRIGETDVPLEFDTFDTSSPGRHLQFLTHEQWNRFDLFGLGEKQADTWHERHRDELSKLSSKYVKKQDSIYELVHIEKQHCANLIFLQYGYRDRLMRERILSMKEVDRLIPGVLDTLLAFHLRLLERLLDRLEEKQHVDTISDIIAEELSEAIDRKPCINAYTQFGLAKEQAETFFNQLILKNSKFYEFIQHCNEEPIYKKFEFKPLLAKIIGRPTKYSIILENILKNEKEFAPEKEQTERAIKATKGFAQLINHSLLMSQMLRRLDTILQNVDPSSKTIIYIQDAQKANHVIPHEFTVEDLNLGVNTGPDSRELRCIGDVYLKQPGDNKIPIIMILFDDILLCLYRRNNKYHFLQDQSVFPIYSLIVRYPERAHSIFLLVSGKPKLLEVEFKSKQDKGLWTEAIELAISNSRREGGKPVRLTASTKNEAEDRVAQEQKAAEDKWLADLERLFRERESQEAGLSNYLESRFLFFDSIRTHIATLPFTTRADISDRVKQVVRQKFRELRLARTTPLNKLVERISASRDADLWTFFNDKVDCAIDPSDSQDSDESGAGSGESGLRRPRRIQTFHGTTPEQSSRGSDRSLRRHTTVPRTHSGLPIPLKDDAGEGSSHGGERYHFPYANSEESRHATERLVREVVKLRLENNRLRDENALVKTRSALIERTRVPQNVAAPSDSMEQLRKKEQLLRDKDEQLKTEQRLLDEDRAQLRKEEERFRTQEQDLGDKWTAFLETQSKMACIVDGNHPTSPMPSSSPVAAITSISGRGLINSSLRSTSSFRDLPRSPNHSILMNPALDALKEKSEVRPKKRL